MSSSKTLVPDIFTLVLSCLSSGHFSTPNAYLSHGPELLEKDILAWHRLLATLELVCKVYRPMVRRMRWNTCWIYPALYDHAKRNAEWIRSLKVAAAAIERSHCRKKPHFYTSSDVQEMHPIWSLACSCGSLRALHIHTDGYLCVEFGEYLSHLPNLTDLHLTANGSAVHISSHFAQWLSAPSVASRIESLRVSLIALEEDYRIGWEGVFQAEQPVFQKLREWEFVCAPFWEHHSSSIPTIVGKAPPIALFIKWIADGILPGQLELFNVEWEESVLAPKCFDQELCILCGSKQGVYSMIYDALQPLFQEEPLVVTEYGSYVVGKSDRIRDANNETPIAPSGNIEIDGHTELQYYASISPMLEWSSAQPAGNWEEDGSDASFFKGDSGYGSDEFLSTDSGYGSDNNCDSSHGIGWTSADDDE